MTLTKVRKVLASCAFNPRELGSLSTIVSCNDQEYLVKRGIEVLQSALAFKDVERLARLRDGIAILAYAMTCGA